MRITVFGAMGNIGRRVINESLARGYLVTAVSRTSDKFDQLDSRVLNKVADINNTKTVRALAENQDIIVSATRPPAGMENQLVHLAKSILEGLEDTNTRLMLVGGAACLTVPNSNGRLVYDDPNFVQPAWKDIAKACLNQYQLCKGHSNKHWTYMSPPAFIEPGFRTGNYRHQENELLMDDKGDSKITFEDFAVALLDEIENKKYQGSKFTVAY